MNSTALKRIMAFFADYVFIVLYSAALFGVVYALRAIFGIDLQLSLTGSVLFDFVVLTLPVIAYFILTESGGKQGSLGKQIIKIKVYGTNTVQAPLKSVITRNLLKFLPWEMAHIGVRWLKYTSDKGAMPETGIWMLLLIPQLLLLVYFFSIMLGNGRQSVYDKAAGTQVA